LWGFHIVVLLYYFNWLQCHYVTWSVFSLHFSRSFQWVCVRCTSVTQFYHPGIITDRSTAARFVPSIPLCSVLMASSALPLWPSFLHQRQFINRFTCCLPNLWSVLSTYTISKFLKKKYLITRPNVFIAVVNCCFTKHVTT